MHRMRLHPHIVWPIPYAVFPVHPEILRSQALLSAFLLESFPLVRSIHQSSTALPEKAPSPVLLQ